MHINIEAEEQKLTARSLEPQMHAQSYFSGPNYKVRSIKSCRIPVLRIYVAMTNNSAPLTLEAEWPVLAGEA